MVDVALKNFPPDSARQVHKLSIKTTWAKYCQQIGLYMVNMRGPVGIGGKSGGKYSRLPVVNLSGFWRKAKCRPSVLFLF